MAIAKNTKILIGDAEVSEAFTQILGVTEISWDGTQWDTEETTNHDDATPVRTSVPTVYSNGNINLVITHDPANTNHALLKSLSVSGAARNFQLDHVNDAEHVQFEGFVTSHKFDTPKDGIQKANVTIMVNGAFEPVV